MRRRRRTGTLALRRAVEGLPRRTREAMVRGIDTNRIVVGAYVDPASGGVCPMLAAHRNGGRTSVAGFARAWDAFTGARRPRRATRREVRILRSFLVQSLTLEPTGEDASIAELAAQVRAERERLAGCEQPEPEIRIRRRDSELDLLAAAEAALADEGRWERADVARAPRRSPGSVDPGSAQPAGASGSRATAKTARWSLPSRSWTP